MERPGEGERENVCVRVHEKGKILKQMRALWHRHQRVWGLETPLSTTNRPGVGLSVRFNRMEAHGTAQRLPQHMKRTTRVKFEPHECHQAGNTLSSLLVVPSRTISESGLDFQLFGSTTRP